MPIENLRVAILHDWLNGLRGGERVLEAICELFPQAEIFTLFHEPGKAGPIIERHTIHASFLNRFPATDRYYRYLLPLFPLAMERFDLGRFDLVISSSHCVAKGALIPPDAVHVCYCHTPMRYAWDRYSDYFGGSRKEAAILPFIHYLRMWDVTSSARVDEYVTNSRWVGNRIRKYYRRDSQVLHPFVDLERFLPKRGEPREDYYLIVSAFAPYKRIDLAIEACNVLDRPLWIVGTGQDSARLQRLAGPRTRFLGRIDGEELPGIYRRARALLFPGEEDFGISPLEAMASGTPVLAYGRGGVTESVVEGETGHFFHAQRVPALVEALERFESLRFSPETCRRRAEQFRREEFKHRFAKIVEGALNDRHELSN
jgi:glycosyltransferase involved in cell wall biosynthesis